MMLRYHWARILSGALMLFYTQLPFRSDLPDFYVVTVKAFTLVMGVVFVINGMRPR